MAKDKKEVVTPTADTVEVDYSKLSKDELLEAIGKAYSSKNMKLMGTLSKLYTKKEQEEEKAKKEALLTELVSKTTAVRTTVQKFIDEMASTGELDGAEGVWFAYDFGEIREVGINPSCRLVKSGRKASGEGGGSSGKSSYKAGLPPTEEMLKVVGDEVYINEETEVTIDKIARTLPAGMTYREAHELSTNGGWRNRIRMALGKATGNI